MGSGRRRRATWHLELSLQTAAPMDISVNHRAQDDSVEVVLHRGGEGKTISYSSEDVRLVPRGETAVAGLLLVAMAAGEDLCVDVPLDPTFAHNLSTIQEIYSTWGEGLSQIEVEAPPSFGKTADEEREGKAAAFFSGGVDSFYTLLKHEDEIDALVFVHGFDVSLEDSELRTAVSQRLRNVADAFDKQLIEVETSLKSVTEQDRFTSELANWELSHGSALASVMHALPACVDRVYVAATQSYRHLFPWGSHPILDPQWKRSDLDLVHDGCEVTRLQKVDYISTSTKALENLRVCWKNPDQAYNCGQCEKCRRTMLELLSVGSLEDCSTFSESLNTSDVGTIRVRKKTIERHYREVAKRLDSDGKRGRYKDAIKRMLWWSRMRRTIKKIPGLGGIIRRLRTFMNWSFS